jgi:hypothetical protein
LGCNLKFRKIIVGQVPLESVRNKNILNSIVVEVLN